MSFYNTGNPVPSIDPRDLDDNAKHIDELTNSTFPTFVDRKGVTRRTLAGIEADADAIVLRDDLANATDPAKGASLVGRKRSGLSAQISNVNQALDAQSVSIWEYAASAAGYSPGGDPSTWDWVPAFAAAVSAGVTHLTLAPGKYSALVNMTVPDTLTLEFQSGAYLDVAAGKVVTINGGLIAPPTKIFSGLGAFNGSPKIHFAYAEWFGAKVNDGLVDNAPLIQRTLNFHHLVHLLRGVYYLNSTITMPYSSRMIGAGNLTFTGYDDTALFQQANAAAVKPAVGAGNLGLINMILRGTGAGASQDGILFPSHGSGSLIQNLWIKNFGRDGIRAEGSAATGLDLVKITQVKVEGCGGYGVRLDLDVGAGNGFNTSLFELLECTKNKLGGFYFAQANSNTFLRCHSFQNSNPALVPCHGYTVGANTSNLKFINCWAETDGEIDNVDPTHTSAGYQITGGTSHSFDTCHTSSSAIGMHFVGGSGHVVSNPQLNTTAWASSAEIIIETAATNIRVKEYLLRSGAIAVNFSATSRIELVNDLPTTGRIPYNTRMGRGVRGVSQCYTQGTAVAFQLNGTVSATAGNTYLSVTGSNALHTGDNITIPGAGTAGAALLAQILSVDMVLGRLNIDKTIITSITNQVAATSRANVYSETYAAGVSGADLPGAWQIGDKIWYLFPNASNRMGWVNSADGSPGTYKNMPDLVP